MTISSDNLSQALAAGGALATAYDDVWLALWNQPYLPVTTLELCRLRLAQLHGSAADIALRLNADLDEEKAQAVLAGHYTGTANFSEAELVMLEFAEVYAQDPAAISDDMADRVKQHVGETGLVCLVEALGFIDGRLRLALMFESLLATGA